MADDRTLAYADALFAVARAEGSLEEVEDELFRFSQTLQGSDELREALTDARIPAARRQQIVEDLLDGKASPVTAALVSMVVGAGRARELPVIIRQLVERSAAEANKEVVVDPSVLGGLVAQVGDTVIDGSVRNRLDQLKQAL
jgi:F-type H+-transporting ATPase subunit delta